MKEEREYKDVVTSELLDFVGKEYGYEDEVSRDRKQDYQDELEQREPFNAIKYKIDRMQKEINEVKDAVEKLLVHNHNGRSGLPVVKIDDSLKRVRY